MDRRRFVPALVIAALLLAGGYACVGSHITKDIQPPGGCDQCHRGKIGGNWEISVVPVPLGKDGGPMEARDLVLREVRQVPYHRGVPTKRLEVFAAAAPPAAVGGEERGIQCFVCHRSPEDPPHKSLRGQFHHPWDQGGSR